MKILQWDIEATQLDADMGFMVSFGWKMYGERWPHAISIHKTTQWANDPTNDEGLVRQAVDILSNADIWVTWYGARFDVPFVDSRLIVHALPPLPPVPHIDLWRIAKYQLKLTSNRLANVSEFLGLEEKTPLTKRIWTRAASGHRGSLEYVAQHCRQDCEVLGQVYERLRPLAHAHPNLALLIDEPTDGKPAPTYCPICGAKDRMVYGRERISRVSRIQLYQCRACGGWSQGHPQREKIFVR